MRRRENRRIDASRHEPAHTRRGIAADNHLNIRKLHAPLFERQLQREIVGATVVKDVYSLAAKIFGTADLGFRSEEHTSELQSRRDLVCRLLLEKKKIK